MKQLLAFFLFLLINSSVQADLKSWLHGAPPKAAPGPPDPTGATVSFAPGVAQDKEVLEFMRALAEALRVHDGTSLKPRLSPNFKLEELPAGQNAVELMMEGILRAKPFTEIIINAVEPEGDGRLAKVELRSADRPPRLRSFHFEADGKLVRSDLFKVQRHGHGH